MNQIMSDQYEERNKRTHTTGKVGKHYECDICKKKFRQKGNLTIHKITHTRDKPYECDVCKKRFRQLGNLTIHKRTHTGDKPYECDVCKKIFRQLGNLTIHKRTHTGDKPYECDVCKKRFRHSSHSVRHKSNLVPRAFPFLSLAHTGDKPYECHTRTHTGEKPYECDVCKKRFIQSNNLASHKKQHLFCNSCCKEIIEPQDLQGHFVKDKSIGKYVCNKCNKRFSKIMNLVQHLATQHGNDGNYQLCGLCQELGSKEPTGVGYVCDVVFDFPRDLEDHMATHDSI